MFSRIAIVSTLLALATVPAHGAPFAYVTDSGTGTVSVIDAATNSITATIPLGGGAIPDQAVVDPSGKILYVLNQENDSIAVVNLNTGVVDSIQDTGFTGVYALAVSPSGATLYVANNGNSTVSVVDTTSKAVTNTVLLSAPPTAMAANPQGGAVYVTLGNGSFTVIDTATLQAFNFPLVGGGLPMGVAVTPSGTRAYFADTLNSIVKVIDTANISEVASPDMGAQFNVGVAVNGAGTRAYVTNGLFDKLKVIDTTTHEVVGNVSVSSGPTGVCVSPAGDKVFVVNSLDRNVSIIDAATNLVITTLAFGDFGNPVAVACLTYDTIPPGGTITINGGGQYATSTAATLALSADDNSGAVTSMQVSLDGSTWSAWEAYATGRSVNLNTPAGDGTKRVYVRFRDIAGNVSESYSDDIVLDTTAPAGSVVINGGAAKTAGLTATLSISASDNLSSVASMQFSKDGVTWGAWEAYATTRTTTLDTPAGDGTKKIYVRFKDGAGNVSSAYSDDIILDTAPPVGSFVKIAGDPPAYFTKLADAYAAASIGAPVVLQARSAEFTENLVLNRAVSSIFQGGYDSLFTTRSGYSTVKGTLTIASGSLTVDGLIIK